MYLKGSAAFAEGVLGKRVIRAKDTPGFISTRLGMYALTRTLGTCSEARAYGGRGGPNLNRSHCLDVRRVARFRLADVVGLDITARIAANLKASIAE